MSGIEDSQNTSEQDDTQETTETAEISNEVASTIDSIEESDSSELSEKSSTKESEERREEIEEKEQEKFKEKEQEEVKEVKQEEIKEKEREEIKETGAKETPSREKTQKEETSVSELATVTRSASSDDGVPVLGIAAKQAEPGIGVPLASTIDDGDGQQRRVSGPSAAVGEWNSLPILVERLREALELSLAAGCRRGSDEPTATSLVGSGNGTGTDGIGDRSYARRSMELALLGSDHNCDHDLPISRKDELKFLEDLLLSDIQTALSRLRETLERTDVATLAKYGGVSDPTSKLYLLRLVSSLLSRLQVPAEEKELSSNVGDRTTDVAAQGGSAPPGRRRRPVRHTIGVSTEEIARARRQLEESSADLARLNDQVFLVERPEPLLSASRNVTSNERPHVEEIHDKYTKDVINQRQSLRDKNKGTSVYRPLFPPQTDYADRPTVAPRTEDELNVRQTRHQDNVDDCQEKVNDDEETAIKKASEEQSRVTKLAAVLRQRAELISADKCNNSNKFAVKKSKIKRANTIDIPSYLKLQADSLGYENPGCVLLRRPINVGDKITANTSNLGVPSFHPRTDNDKKFLALINRNNETQAYNAVPAFVKSFGYSKVPDMSQTNENWNSRFSNIKTTFDKSSSASDADKLSPRLQNAAKRFPDTLQTSPQVSSKKTSTSVAHNDFSFTNANASQSDTGFKHAPSSLFRKIEKPHTPKSPPGHHWQRDNVSGNSLREKARMFDQDSNQSQPLFNANKNTQKSTFPRPPWIEHDRNEGRSNKMVTENGRLDYRLFCKQFAPFIGKNAVPEAENVEDYRKRNEHSNVHRKNLIPLNEKLGVVDGKISFRMFPEKGSQVQYRPSEPCPSALEETVCNKLDIRNKKDVSKPLTTVRNNNNSSETTAGIAPIDAMLKGISSVAIQTGINDDSHPGEARVFRVVPRVTMGPPSARNNVSIQTHNEPEVEVKEHWMTPQYNDTISTSNLIYHPAEDPNHFILDHNRNYHAVTDFSSRNEALSLENKNECDLIKENTVSMPYSTEKIPLQVTSNHQSEQRKPTLQTNPRCENYFSPKSTMDNGSQMYPTYAPYVKSNKNLFENQSPSMSYEVNKENSLCTSDGALPEEENIQNQDISADTGVVTRYTCAIATVASTDVTPATQLNEIKLESRSSPSSSLSPLQIWPHPKPVSNETNTTEDEIRRHNMLQQSLVRQLQNERAVLNDYHTSVINQSDNFNQPNSFHQSNSFNLSFQPSEVPKRLELSKRPEPPKRPELPRRPEPPKRFEPPRRPEPPKRFELPKKPELSRRSESSKKLESPKRLEPSRRIEPPAVVTGLLSVTPSSGFGAKNRITALREQYEQPGSQSRPTQKERSPISNGANSANSAMDSSDEYLVSCINRPSRSIVLSKSESWHQLALSKGHHASLRSVQGKLPPQPLAGTGSYLPKPPKPKSPSSFKVKKQYEASSSSDSVKKMEDKIRRYFDNPTNDDAAETRDSKGRRFSSRDSVKKGHIGLSRSRTMPGICDESLRLTIPTVPQIPVASLNSADVDKVFDDIFEEATRTDDHRF